MKLKWVGIDFGQCLMEPTGLRTYLVIGDIYKELGRPEKIAGAVKKFRVIAEAYGGHSLMKESHRDKIQSYVLDGDEEAMEIFNKKEKEHLSTGQGAAEAFKYLTERGISVNMVAELKKTLGAMGKDVVSTFLRAKDLTEYIDCMYTPQGKANFKTGDLDQSYAGKTKESGLMYVRLLEELGEKGIKPEEMLMVGDKIATDIVPANRVGIRTAQYTGYIDMGESVADYRVSTFYELIDLLKGMGV